MDYADAWDLQTRIHQGLVERKRAIWRGESPEGSPEHTFILCEHPPVFTLGKSGSEDHLRLDEDSRRELGFQYFRINRGGDITYHGPGQVVGYPILDLEDFYCDVHRYVRDLEEVMIRVMNQYGLQGERDSQYTGVWLSPANGRPWRKICAIGVHLSRWVSLHGFAFNISTDLSHFQHIVPCGIKEDDRAVTSMAAELGYPPDLEEIKASIARHFADVFECTLQST